MIKGYVYWMLSALLGVFLLLQTGCAGSGTGYSRYPYDSYYGYPHPFGGYYGYPYDSHYWWPYHSYPYRDYRYRYTPRDPDDGDHRIGRPRPPHERDPYRFRPTRPKGMGPRQPLDRPIPH